MHIQTVHYLSSLSSKGVSLSALEVPATGLEIKGYKQAQEKRRTSSHSHSSSKLITRHESRRHGVVDDKIEKPEGSKSSSWYKSAILNTDPRHTKPSCILIERKPQLITLTNVKEPEEIIDISEIEDKSAIVPQVPRPERFNELSPLMTKIVAEELKNIMIKVWEKLPDTVNNKAEQYVINKFKNKVGDNLRNTIGLNITKRLLNVHSGILVKVKIPSSVSSFEIYTFGKQYNISELKHVQRQTYAGRITSWDDLDELCTRNNLRCGKFEVNVAPVYNFTKCPPDLKTIYDGTQDYSKFKELEMELARTKKHGTKTAVNADQLQKSSTKTQEVKKDNSFIDKNPDAKKVVVKIEKKDEANTAKNKEVAKNIIEKAVNKTTSTKVYKQSVPNRRENTILKSNEIKSEKKVNMDMEKAVDKTTNTKVSIQSVPKRKGNTILKSNEIKSEKTVNMDTTRLVDNKPPSAIIIKKEINSDTRENKVGTSKTIMDPLITIGTPRKDGTALKPDVKIKVEPTNKPVKEPTNPNNKLTTTTDSLSIKKENISKPSEVKKPEVKKEPVKTVNKPSSTTTVKKEGLKSKPIETKSKSNAKLTKVTPKPTIKESPKVPVKSTKINMKVGTKGNKNENDFDELSDHDILALLSSGIVLDECSGSDEDIKK